ncbi:MAG TPA: methionine--tRNA ligase [Candidatus Cloacimonas sp.]|jgi:methionyl-tRNA synthetase|nr:methionine--tRNA ligase [Candidatus Cloacimonas sp.]MDD2250917.1 methionine--tRNA ligase [Candidatus Cloacimonadota bacterium]MCK9158751.1 methionine--tRNA ligase [Candidatus Cloacimonas sp.]HNZ33443.1 methionine--tRNA ligase [Candidatus Cloacimonas sp.]HOG27274.1 methionine--tRNA ligase [Candidatus Cloacimonas sp.]
MKYLITSALPYANGRLHIGHIAGAYLPADIFVRYLRLKDEDVIYICGTDEHGTPISITADKEGITPQEVVNRYHQSIKEAFDGIGIEFDNFSGTARPPHYKLASEFFLQLYNKDFIKPKITLQFYCEHDKRYLPDRYVEGLCPRCGASNARGDQCDKCGQIYETTTLQEPKCKICGSTPVIKETKHWFLQLDGFRDKLKRWLSTKDYWKENVRNFIFGLLDQGLVERSITRDLSWGVPVPLPEAKGKVLYVWFDAPIGYISSTVEWAEKIGQPEKWKEYWLNPETRLIHFIGKDNIIFHSLIWPAMLMGQDKKYCLPYDIPANEFMNLEGEKISTSKNWAIWVDEFLQDFEGEYLRYYLAVNAPEKQDSDFCFKDFQSKINTDLNNTLGNLANRVFAFANKNFEGKITACSLSKSAKLIIDEADAILKEIEECYLDYQVKKNTRLIMDIARLGNRYFDENKPWAILKENREAVNETLYVCANLLAKISVALFPILPSSMLKLREMMGLSDQFLFNEAYNILDDIKLTDIKPLFHKIEDKEIEAQIAKLHLQTKINEGDKVEFATSKIAPLKELISYDDFSKLDFRLAKVLTAEKIPNTDKLLKLQVDIGIETRELVAGIAADYEPQDLIGKTILMLVNLEPRKIRGINSQGMILAANANGKLLVLNPDGEGNPGSVVQ